MVKYTYHRIYHFNSFYKADITLIPKAEQDIIRKLKTSLMNMDAKTFKKYLQIKSNIE